MVDKVSRTYAPTVKLRGQVVKGIDVRPDVDKPGYLEAVVYAQCDDLVYRLDREAKWEYHQEIEKQYQAIMAAGMVYAEGRISHVAEEGISDFRMVVLVDHWQPVGPETGNGAPAGASRGKTVTLILQPGDGQDFSGLPDCIEVKSDLAASMEAMLRAAMKNGLAFQH